MSSTSTVITGLILLPATGLMLWIWYSMDRFEEDLREFSPFDKAHFEIGPQATQATERPQWATPG